MIDPLANQGTAIRDAVWGDVLVGHRELALIDTRAFQRLRHVKQLGFTSLTFPGAQHTRFEHSIGVYHLTREALLHLLRQPDAPSLTEEDVLTVLAAALVHDIGHYPFSHAVEELELSTLRDHELISQQIIVESEVATVLREVWGVEPARVAHLIRRSPAITGVDVLLSNLLTGDLDTDKLDYLVRDARACNVPYGSVDVERLMHALCIWRDSSTGMPRLVVNEKGIGPMQSLIFAKYMMFANVYWHHTSRIATVMFLRALHDALDAGAIKPHEIERSDDRMLLRMLQDRCLPESTTARLVDSLELRKVHKRAIVLTHEDPLYDRLKLLKAFPSVRRDIELHWVAHMGTVLDKQLDDECILLDIPESKRFGAAMDVVCAVPPRGHRNPVPWAAISGLTEQDLARYQRAVHRVRIVAQDESLAQAVASQQHELMIQARHIIARRGLDRKRPSLQTSLEL
jgi:HD superfamily phosphohydrolase